MSQWTHINAVIRFDVIRVLGMKMPDLGKTLNYEGDDDISDWEDEECTVPCGSEGSMRYQVWENPSPNSAAGYTAMFWGDLRDYSDVEKIFNYFVKITSGQMIRSGLLEIEVEGNDDILIYRYADDKWNQLISK